MCTYVRSDFFRTSVFWGFFCEWMCHCSISSIGKKNRNIDHIQNWGVGWGAGLRSWVTGPHTNTVTGEESGKSSPVYLCLKDILPVTVVLRLGIFFPQLKNVETPKIDTVREDLPCWLVPY